jgi:GDPmannose 4,6-dehydratase
MNILITGAAGQAGSYLSELLIEGGHRVIGLVRRNSTSESHWRLERVLNHRNFILEVGDVTDPMYIFSLLTRHKPDIIYNTAAQSHVHISFSQPLATFDSVALGCINILEAVRLINQNCTANFNPHIIQFSSSEMFGSNSVKVNEEDVQNESTPFSPNSPYSIAKLAAHNYCLLFRRAYKIRVSPVILFNYESPRRGEQFVTKKITTWIAELKYNKEKYGIKNIGNNTINFENSEEIVSMPKLRLGNIHSVRDWGHCRDYMRAMIKIGEREPGDYILSTGQIFSVSNFLQKCLHYIGIYDDMKNYFITDDSLLRPLEVPYLKGDCSKTMRKLDWKPTITVDNLVKEMIDFDYEKIRRRRV